MLLWVILLCIFFFFFQAEDGIRDYKVTGVQTCALPIWRESGFYEPDDLSRVLAVEPSDGVRAADYPHACLLGAQGVGEILRAQLLEEEIGRASCRERV